MSKQSAVESAPTVGPTSPTPLAQEATKPDPSSSPTAAPTLGLPQLIALSTKMDQVYATQESFCAYVNSLTAFDGEDLG